MEYTILQSSRLDFLIKMVNEHIANGWIPQGGVTTTDDFYYLQPMIKNIK
jgi:hypothetical protein